MANPTELDAVVVGAGFAGLHALYRLRELGFRTRVVEAGKGVGGAWFWNKYPGARCDSPSMSYSYSFSPELEQEWEWTEKYPTQPEVLRYLDHVADRFDLRKDITFNARVTSAVYNEKAKRWVVNTDTGASFDVQYLITAAGCISAPKMLEEPGVERFRGRSYYTGQWPDEEVDFTNLRVAVIGTGSSGVQAIPMIAQQAARLTVFQRTPTFSLPAMNCPLTDDEIAHTKANYAAFRKVQRNSVFGDEPPEMPTKSALEASDEERLARYEAGWAKGGLVHLMMAYTDIMTNKAANDTLADFVRSKIQSIVTNPTTAESLSPRSYALGTKRCTVDTNYYATFNSPHVHLVDLRKTPLLEITENGIRTSETEYEVDAIVYATGYDATTGALTRIDIRGRNGVTLKEKWASGARTYLGVAVAGFPNMFTITGPLSPSVLSNVVVSIEQHVEWICECVRFLRESGVEEIEAEAEAEDEWVEHARFVAECTLFPDTASPYTGGNVPGKARGLLPYAGGVGAYRQKCDDVASKGYEGFRLISATSSR
ncbi:hypothetical protein M758_11G006500 [Ceratodon purpureus]|uniref:Cyclohexanone monooxygenase n=1 Tax=Ceratodon purpureus TaxID=3225 RepID=A0A8T0GF86_CERPU|nr:hypothetical protein KC19_11G007600 [Ceratodon purpureus]KAG0600086.1 hypothetical protein M758_11G006500 [Ceratodon purpureus]